MANTSKLTDVGPTSGIFYKTFTFYCNREFASANSKGGTYSGQMFVEFLEPFDKADRKDRPTIVLLHGDHMSGQVSLSLLIFTCFNREMRC